MKKNLMLLFGAGLLFFLSSCDNKNNESTNKESISNENIETESKEVECTSNEESLSSSESVTINTYIINLDPDGGSGLDSFIINATQGEVVSLPTPEKKYYSFDGWYNDDGTTKYDQEITCFSDLNLKAKWIFNFTYEIVDDTATITGLNNKYVECLSIPSTIDGKKVVIAEGAFIRSGIREAIIEDGITDIPKRAFCDCDYLTKVSISDSVTNISDNAFASSSKLEEIKMPINLTNLGGGAFGNCPSLKNIDIPNSVTKIGNMAFSCCTSLESITLPEKLEEIADCLFENCLKLKEVTMPQNVTRIGHQAFFNHTIKAKRG